MDGVGSIKIVNMREAEYEYNSVNYKIKNFALLSVAQDRCCDE